MGMKGLNRGGLDQGPDRKGAPYIRDIFHHSLYLPAHGTVNCERPLTSELLDKIHLSDRLAAIAMEQIQLNWIANFIWGIAEVYNRSSLFAGDGVRGRATSVAG
jgi:hypothetical protein